MGEKWIASVLIRTVDHICIVDPKIILRSILVTGFQASTTSEKLIIHFQRTQNGGGDVESITRSCKRQSAVITFHRSEVVSSVLRHLQICDDIELTVQPYSEAEPNGEVLFINKFICEQAILLSCSQPLNNSEAGFDDLLQYNLPVFTVFEVVTAELCMDYVNSLSREETAKLLGEVEAKIGVRWIKSAESFTISGTLRQIEEAHMVLEKGMYLANGVEVVSDPEMKNEVATSLPRKNRLPLSLEDQNDVEMDVDQNHVSLTTTDQVNDRPGGAEELDTDQGDPSKSHSFEIQSFEVQPKIVKAIVEAHKEELDKIETEYRVEVPRKAEGDKMALRPRDACSAEDYQKACDLFVTLYQKIFQLFKVERFSIKGVPKMGDARKAMKKLEKEFPVSIEKSKDQKQWEMYGEAGHIGKALSFLKKQGVEIERESKNVKSGSDLYGKDTRSQGDEVAMYGGGTEYPRDATSSGARRLEIYHGRVKLSVYQGDLTSEHVDVIVNASNTRLDHDGGLAKAIVDKGGKIIESESRAIMRKRKQLKDGDAVFTKSGNLPCKFVVHAFGPDWSAYKAKKSKEILRRACLSSLSEAQKLNMTSIALPAIGSGNCGMPKEICANVMCDAVDEFIRQENSHTKMITDIRFVNNDEPSVLAFSKELKMRFGDDSVKPTLEGGSFSSRAGGDSSKSGLSKSDRGRNRKTNNSRNGETHSPSEQSSYSPDDKKSAIGQSSSQGDFSGNGSKINPPGNDASHPVTHYSLGATSSATVHNHPWSAACHTSPPGGSYSNALQRNTAGSDASPPRTQQPAASGGERGSKEEECPICLTAISNPRSLKCKHVFCSVCIETALNVRNKCPVCQKPQGVLKGNQPPGQMTTRVNWQSLPGYEGYGTIIIDYSFASGIQGIEHPNPGQYYGGTNRQAYLPDSREGREVLQLLMRAFDARLVFTVGTSTTSGLQNQITWNDIHHKTSRHGGPFGYPDPDYLRRVKEELADKGIH